MDFSILVLGVSLHWGDPRQAEHVGRYEDFNPGLGIGYHHDQLFATAGYYRNSVDRDSLFASVGVEAMLTKHVGVTGSAMLVTGYIPHQDQPLLAPIVGGFYQYEKTRLHAVFVYDGVAFFLEQQF